MFNLQTLFKQDGEASKPTGCVLAGVVVQQKHEAHFAPQLKELGLKIDDRVEKDGVVILRQCEYDEDDVTIIQLNEMGGLFLNASEAVQKQFDPFPEGTDFAENFNQGAFLPGVSIATEVMMETMRNVLRTADDQTSARSGIEMLLTAYTSHILDFVDDLPEVAFKIDVLGLTDYDETPAPDGDSAADSQDTSGEGDAGDDEAGKDDAGDAGDNADSESDDGAGDADTGDAGDAGDSEAGAGDDAGDGGEESASGQEDAGQEEAASQETVSKDDQSSGDDSSSEQSEESEPDIAAVVKAALAPVLEAVSGVRKTVDDLKTKQDKLAEKVEATAEVAEKARKAVKGTVPSNSDGGDTVIDQSLGTHRSKGEASDEKLWGGTSLDRIAGDLESAA